MEFIISTGGLKRYLYIELVGYGRPETGTVVTDNPVSGIWDRMGSPYYIVDNLSVGSGERLVIKPGVKIMVQPLCLFEIGDDAQLIAIGSESDSVYFSAFNPEKGWQGIYLNSSGDDDTLSYCIISKCITSNDKGGAVNLDSTNLTIMHSKFIQNQAIYGGAIFARNSTPTITRSVFMKNSGKFGGALYLRGIKPATSNAMLDVNSLSTTRGNNSLPVINLNNFIQNNAQVSGGAIFMEHSELLIENCLFDRNTALKDGNMLSCGKSSLHLHNITAVHHNQNIYSGLIALNRNTNVTIKNSILWNNATDSTNSRSLFHLNNSESIKSSVDTLRFDFTTIEPSLMDNLLHDESSVVVKKGYYNKSDDPLFLDYDNGNYKLQSNSPCVDAGDPDDSVGDEVFPHGYCRNAGAYGGTADACPTTGAKLTVSPYPLDLGKLKTRENVETTVYLKNGSLNDIHITDFSVKDTAFIELFKFTDAIKSTGDMLMLEQGDIDSLSLLFKPSALNAQTYNTSVLIRSHELPEIEVPFIAEISEGTKLNGYIEGTLSKKESPYYVNGTLTVSQDKTLIIEPGVHLIFTGKFQLRVMGILLAIGNETDSIRFYAKYPESGWRGVQLSGDENKIEYCDFQDVNSHTEGALNIKFGSLNLRHNRFSNNRSVKGGAIYAYFGYLRISHCSF